MVVANLKVAEAAHHGFVSSLLIEELNLLLQLVVVDAVVEVHRLSRQFRSSHLLFLGGSSLL